MPRSPRAPKVDFPRSSRARPFCHPAPASMVCVFERYLGSACLPSARVRARRGNGLPYMIDRAMCVCVLFSLDCCDRRTSISASKRYRGVSVVGIALEISFDCPCGSMHCCGRTGTSSRTSGRSRAVARCAKLARRLARHVSMLSWWRGCFQPAACLGRREVDTTLSHPWREASDEAAARMTRAAMHAYRPMRSSATVVPGGGPKSSR